MTGEQLFHCRQADILTCDTNNLVDLKSINIPADLPLPLRTEQYLEQVGNPYLFRVDKLIVKVSFTGEKDLSSTLTNLLAFNQ